MKKSFRSIFSLLLCFALVLSFSIGTATSAYADDSTGSSKTEQVTLDDADFPESEAAGEVLDVITDEASSASYSSGTFSPVNVNSSATAEAIDTPYVTRSTDYTYTVKMPVAGTLRVYYAFADAAAGGYLRASLGNTTLSGTSCDRTVNGTTVKGKMFVVGSASNVTLTLTVYTPETTYVNGGSFTLEYMPKSTPTRTAPVGKFGYYYHGGTGTTANTTSIKIKVTSKGYLNLLVGDLSQYPYSLYIKTSGFAKTKGEYLTSKDAARNIGVKPGVYTITVRSYAPAYGIRYRLYKVSETKFGKKKSKAVTMKKNKVSRGLIVTNAKQVHWYKFKNTKKHKVKLYVNAKLNGGGNYAGGIKITVYGKKGKSTYSIIYADKKSATIALYNLGGNKLAKGTYRVKVESYKSGNGYYTLKWK